MSALDTQIGGAHYKSMKIQPVEFITVNGIGFLEGCVIKRVCRWRAKDGLQDLEKAKHELDLLIEQEKKRIGETRADSAKRRCTCLSAADCSGQCFRGSEPL